MAENLVKSYVKYDSKRTKKYDFIVESWWYPKIHSQTSSMLITINIFILIFTIFSRMYNNYSRNGKKSKS